MENAAIGNYQMVPLTRIRESPLNPRKDYGDLDGLAASIRGAGKVIQPLLGRPAPDGYYEICAGHRRKRAAELAGLTEVPMVVEERSDQQFLADLTFENLGRKDLHELEEAAGFRTLMVELGWDVEKIAENLGKQGQAGKSASYVYARLKLLNLTEDAQAAFLTGTNGMSAGHAILIARLQPKDQARALKQMQPPDWNPGATVSVRSLAEWIRNELYPCLAGAPFALDDVALVLDAGSCQACAKRSGNDPSRDDAETPEKDLCQDGACYGRKLKAHLDRQREALAAQGEFVQITDHYTSKRQDVLGGNQYAPVADKEKGPDIKTALVVDGRDAGKVIRVRVEKPEPSKAPPKPSAAEMESQRKTKEEKAEAERAARIRLLDAILREVKWPLGRSVVESLVSICLDVSDSGLFLDRHPNLCNGRAGKIEEMLAKAKDPDLARYAVEAVLADEAQPTAWSLDKEPVLMARMARAYGVDVKRAREAVEPKKTATPAKKAALPKKPAKKPARKGK